MVMGQDRLCVSALNGIGVDIITDMVFSGVEVSSQLRFICRSSVCEYNDQTKPQ